MSAEVFLVLQIRKLRPTEVKDPAQGFQAVEQESECRKSGSRAFPAYHGTKTVPNRLQFTNGFSVFTDIFWTSLQFNDLVGRIILICQRRMLRRLSSVNWREADAEFRPSTLPSLLSSP